MVKAGYKQTEVGVIPEDWDATEIRKVCRLVNGRGFKPFEWRKHGLPIIRIQNLNGSDEFNYFQGDYDKKLEIYEGQLLFAWSGSRGTSFGPHVWKGPRGLLNYHTWKVVVESDCVDKDYFFKALRKLTKFIEDKAHGASALVHTQKGEMEGFLFPLPPTTEEQKAIAEALSDVDGLIASQEALIEKKRQIKTGTLQQLLTGKTRLPGFSEGKGFKQTELGEIPEDWDVSTYGELFSFHSTATNSRADLRDEGAIKYLHYGDIHTRFDAVLDLKDSELPAIPRSVFKNPSFVQEGDVIMADASEDYEGVGKSIEVRNLGETKLIAGLHTFLMRDHQEAFSNGFRGYLHKITAVKASFDRLATGLKVYGLSKKSVCDVYVPVPPKEEQVEIVTVLDAMSSELNELQNRLTKTKALKQGMMQELLTGRTRLI